MADADEPQKALDFTITDVIRDLGETSHGHRLVLGQEVGEDVEPLMVDSFKKIFSDLLELKVSQRQLHSAVNSLAQGQDQMARSMSRLEVVGESRAPSGDDISISAPLRSSALVKGNFENPWSSSPSLWKNVHPLRRFGQQNGSEVAEEDCAMAPNSSRTESDISEVQKRTAFTLPNAWPKSIELRPSLAQKTAQMMSVDYAAFTDESSRTVMLKRSTATRFNLRKTSNKWVIHPSSRMRLAVDIFSISILMVDLTMIPVVLGWDLELEGLLLYFSLFTCSYWAFDIALSFLTGYHHDGEVVMDINMIFWRYCKGWLTLDFIIVFFDWATTFTAVTAAGGDSRTNSARVLRFAKVSRFMRIVGLLRIIRLARTSEDIIDKYASAASRMMLKVLSIFLVVLWMNHMIGCMWYATGRLAPEDTNMRWTETTISVADATYEYVELHNFYLYITSFHWSMAQMTLGAIDLVAVNTTERIFNILMLLFGMLFSSTLVSSLSATLIGFEMQMNDQNQQLRLLRRYLRQNNVSVELSLRVNQQAEHRMREVQRLNDSDVRALGLLSSSLHGELRFAIFKPHFTTHPLMRVWLSISSPIVQELCNHNVVFRFLQLNDELFGAGGVCEDVFFLVSGGVNYVQKSESAFVNDTCTCSVEEHAWICEAGLWTLWTHVGTAIATSSCQLVKLSAEGTIRTLQKHRMIEEITKQYSEWFHSCVITARPALGSPYPTDLCVPGTEFSKFVAVLPHGSMAAIGLAALKDVVSSRWQDKVHVSAVDFTSLRREVREGRSTVFMNQAGALERVAPIVVMEIRDEEDRFLAMLGRSVDWELTAQCMLPGTKKLGNETPLETVKRYISEKIPQLEELVEFDESGMRREFDTQQSSNMNLQTTYVRTICKGELRGTFDAPCRKASSQPHFGDSGGEPAETAPRKSVHRMSVRRVGNPNVDTWWETLGMTLAQRDVFAVEAPESTADNPEKTFFAWLDRDEFTKLSRVQAALHQWLVFLQPNEKWTCSDVESPERSSVGSFEPDLDDSELIGHIESQGFFRPGALKKFKDPFELPSDDDISSESMAARLPKSTVAIGQRHDGHKVVAHSARGEFKGGFVEEDSHCQV